MPAMGTLPRRADFAESGLAREDAGVSIASQAVFHGIAAILALSREVVTRLVPEPLELAVAAVEDPPANHPVVVLFGEQRHGAVLYGGVPWPLGIRYAELALAVPYVRVADSPRLHTFVAAMGSGYFPAVWHGNRFFGFRKELIEIARQGALWWVSGSDGALRMHAAAQPKGEWARVRALDEPALTEILEFFRLPVVGQREDRSLVTSWWTLSFRNALVRPCEAWVSLDESFVPGLPLGTYPIEQRNAFEIRGMLWQLSWPRAFRE